MNGKRIRLSRLFNPKTGKTVIIPIDHGLIMGNIEGLSDPVRVLKDLIELEIDATLMSPGLGKISSDLFLGKNTPARILTVDFPLPSTTPGNFEDIISHEPAATVEFALRWGFDAVKILFPWCTDKEVLAKTIKLVSEFSEKCDVWGMPLMLEPVLWGISIPEEKAKDPALLENAARMAMEIGADIVKMPYTGDVSRFSEFVSSIHVPVVVLGGPRMKSVRDVLKVAEESIKAGAKGIVFGRNVWQNPSMKDLVKALEDIVHRGSTAEEVIEKYHLA